MPILDLDIAADADDAMWLGASEPPTDEVLSYPSSPNLFVGGLQDPEHERIGLRFALPVPPGATITAAWLVGMSSSGIQDGTTGPDIAVYDSTHVAAFSAAHTHAPEAHDAGGFFGTTVRWTVTAGAGLKTSPDISALVQHVVSRPDWAEGNAIGFALLAGNLGSQWIGFHDASRSGGTPFRLHVEYTEGSPGVTLAATVGGVSSTAASLRVAKPLGAAGAGASGLAVGLRVAKLLAGTAVGASGAVGALHVEKPLAALLAARGAVRGALVVGSGPGPTPAANALVLRRRRR